MNNLNQTEFFTLFLKKQQLKSDQLENAYEKFTEQIKNLNQPENEYTIIYRTLNLTRIELVSLSNHFRYEQGGKCA